MTIDLDELERIAAALTAEAPWSREPRDLYVYTADSGITCPDGQTAAHVVAFQPRVALELVRDIKRLRALLREALDGWEESIEHNHPEPRIAEIQKEAGL